MLIHPIVYYQLNMQLSDIVCKTKLGSGTFGTVYAGTDLRTNQAIAIKKLSRQGQSDQMLRREIQALHSLEHVFHPFY